MLKLCTKEKRVKYIENTRLTVLNGAANKIFLMHEDDIPKHKDVEVFVNLRYMIQIN